jgi:hypothetical protein
MMKTIELQGHCYFLRLISCIWELTEEIATQIVTGSRKKPHTHPLPCSSGIQLKIGRICNRICLS